MSVAEIDYGDIQNKCNISYNRHKTIVGGVDNDILQPQPHDCVSVVYHSNILHML